MAFRFTNETTSPRFRLIHRFVFTGCASVVSGTKQKVAIKSTPPGATVLVTDMHGTIISRTNTPAVVKLKRKKGYFSGASYRIQVDADGYKSSETWLEPNLNPWYVGNLAIGGIIGLVFVDPATGAMYSLSPRAINLTLEPAAAVTNSLSLNIVPSP